MSKIKNIAGKGYHFSYGSLLSRQGFLLVQLCVCQFLNRRKIEDEYSLKDQKKFLNKAAATDCHQAVYGTYSRELWQISRNSNEYR